MGSRVESHQHHPDYVSLAALMSRELKSEKMKNPSVRFGCAAQSRKGEDYFMMKTDCQGLDENPSSTFSVFGVRDAKFYNHSIKYFEYFGASIVFLSFTIRVFDFCN